jgi:energy-coupling factor transporter ATP-binding protein EcfA2
MSKLVIDPSERWIILGKTGSGKTEFVKYLLRIVSGKMPVVIVDPKEYWLGRFPKWAEKKEKGSVDKPRLVDTFNPKWHVQCLQPDPDDPDDDRLSQLCSDVLKHGNVLVYFDESEDIATANFVPKHIRRIWKTGRAKGVGAWVSTQAPRGIPRIFKSQAEHFISLKVGQEDIDPVAELLHAADEDVRGLMNFEWLYYNVKMDVAEWNAPVPYKEKKANGTRP